MFLYFSWNDFNLMWQMSYTLLFHSLWSNYLRRYVFFHVLYIFRDQYRLQTFTWRLNHNKNTEWSKNDETESKYPMHKRVMNINWLFLIWSRFICILSLLFVHWETIETDEVRYTMTVPKKRVKAYNERHSYTLYLYIIHSSIAVVANTLRYYNNIYYPCNFGIVPNRPIILNRDDDIVQIRPLILLLVGDSPTACETNYEHLFLEHLNTWRIIILYIKMLINMQ